MIDATAVNVALPRIGRDLGGGLAALQWTVNAYTLALTAFLLLGGALGDHHGRKRVFLVGVVWFAVASGLCALAPSAGFLIGARALQGIGGALLTPGSLAIIEASFQPEDRSTAIGAWSGLGGVAAAVGPVLGGWLVEAVSWRLIFLINLPLAAGVVWVGVRHVPESRNPGRRQAILPLDLFRSRQFDAANLVTFVVYAALGGALFLVPVVLQVVLGFSPIGAGAALVPITILMLALSARAGRLAQRIGPRMPMTFGPVVAGVGLALLTRVGVHSGYAGAVLPGVGVFGLGLALTVAPLTSAVLAAASQAHVGVASAVNNEVSRLGGFIAVAVLPIAAGISTRTYHHPAELASGFHTAMWITAGLCVAGGLLAGATIRRPTPAPRPSARYHCAVEATPVV